MRALNQVLNFLTHIKGTCLYDVPPFSLTPTHAKIEARGGLYKRFVHGEPKPSKLPWICEISPVLTKEQWLIESYTKSQEQINSNLVTLLPPFQKGVKLA